jgi:hypothetical protein
MHRRLRTLLRLVFDTAALLKMALTNSTPSMFGGGVEELKRG